MGFLKVFVAVELVGCHKGAGLLFVENGLDIDKAYALEIKVDAGALEFLVEQRHIKTVAVETCNVAS